VLHYSLAARMLILNCFDHLACPPKFQDGLVSTHNGEFLQIVCLTSRYLIIY
jgi:hypothetical protein